MMIKEGGEKMFQYLLHFFNICLHQGKHAKESKKDIKIPIPKPFREDYNSIKAYRLITLESLLNKLLWRMLDDRIEWHLESNKLLSQTQDAYRKEHSCNDTILRLVQSIQDAWNANMTVVVCFLDFDSYFENIWRANLICKLYGMGIKGNVLKLIHDYLSERQMRIAVNTIYSRWKTSNVGLPQGGVNSPKLADVYSTDSDNSEAFKHAEFADDNIKLEMHEDEKEASRKMEARLEDFREWLLNNNLSCGSNKVKVMTFRPKESPRPFNRTLISFNGNLIEEVEKYRILGTQLTVDLNFDEHFLKAIKSAYESLKLIKLFAINQQQPREDTILTLYKSLIIPKVDFSVAACINISREALNKLQSLQKDCLVAATQCLNQTSIEVLNAVTNTLPIDLHLKKKAAEELCRIASRDSDVINLQFETWAYSEGRERNSSTYKKMVMSYSQITKHEFTVPQKVSLFHLEINPLEEINVIIQRKGDEETQINYINELVKSDKFDYIVGTDGSSFPNEGSKLGKTGAAAILWRKEDGLTKKVSQTVSTQSNNYEAELLGINIGLKVLEEEEVCNASILILCDCIPAITSSFSKGNRINKDYNQTIIGNSLLVREIINKNNDVKCTWVPGHKQVVINEEADTLAKEAAKGSNKEKDKTPDRKNMMLEINEKVIINWQFRMNQMLSDHRIYEVNGVAKGWVQHKTLMSHPMHKVMKQLVAGHHPLKGYKAMITGESPNCRCGEVETFEHFIYFCERYSKQRYDWNKELSNILEVPSCPIRNVEWKTLFGQNKELKMGTNLKLLKATLEYLQRTKRFKR